MQEFVCIMPKMNIVTKKEKIIKNTKEIREKGFGITLKNRGMMCG